MLYDTTDETFREDMDGLQECLVLFYADDCEPCHELMKELEGYQAPVMQYNLSEFTDRAIEFRVVHPSTLCYFEQGGMGQMNRKKKAFAKGWTLKQIQEWIDD